MNRNTHQFSPFVRRSTNKPRKCEMNSNSFMLLRLGLALVALLSTGISSASAQTVYLETCVEPFPTLSPTRP